MSTSRTDLPSHSSQPCTASLVRPGSGPVKLLSCPSKKLANVDLPCISAQAVSPRNCFPVSASDGQHLSSVLVLALSSYIMPRKKFASVDLPCINVQGPTHFSRRCTAYLMSSSPGPGKLLSFPSNKFANVDSPAPMHKLSYTSLAASLQPGMHSISDKTPPSGLSSFSCRTFANVDSLWV